MDFLDKAVTPFIGVVTAILAVWLSARWAFKKSLSEKWWDRKEKAYGEIVDALYDALQYCEVKISDCVAPRSYSEEKRKELAEKQDAAWWKIRRVAAKGVFLISPRRPRCCSGW